METVEPRRRRRPRARWIWSGVLAALVVAGAVVFVMLRYQDGEYGPIEFAGAGGRGSSPAIVNAGSDDAPRYLLTTRPGQTAYVYSSLDNAGNHSVTITGIDHDSITVGAQWAPWPSDGAIFGPHTPWRDFPTVIKDHSIFVRYEIRRPASCQNRPIISGTGTFYDDVHTVRWQSLLGSHTTTISGFAEDDEIQVC